MGAFDYPETPHERRHGPTGYANHITYRPWLRDEFTFRCVYCLLREQWGRVMGEFDVDHFEPQALRPDLELDYDNLLYACRRCNLAKGGDEVPDPVQALVQDEVELKPDGSLTGVSDDAQRIIDLLSLDTERQREWRVMWMRNVQLAAEYDPEQYLRLMGFPEDLPDVSSLDPDDNLRPEGKEQSWFAKRERGELPETY